MGDQVGETDSVDLGWYELTVFDVVGIEVAFEPVKRFSLKVPYPNIALFEPSSHQRRILRERNTR